MADNYIYDGVGNKYLPFIRVNEVFTDESGVNQFVIVDETNTDNVKPNQIIFRQNNIAICPEDTETVATSIYIKINGELKKVKQVYIGDSNNNPKHIITFS